MWMCTRMKICSFFFSNNTFNIRSFTTYLSFIFMCNTDQTRGTRIIHTHICFFPADLIKCWQQASILKLLVKYYLNQEFIGYE